jgi:hypothetical protein
MAQHVCTGPGAPCRSSVQTVGSLHSVPPHVYLHKPQGVGGMRLPRGSQCARLREGTRA